MSELDVGTAGLVRRLAQRVAQLEQQTRDLGRASQAQYRSVEGGAQSLYDDDDELRAIVGEQVDGSYTITTYGGPPPAAPSAPLVATFPGGATITWDGFDANDESAWPINFARVNVHLSTMPGDPPTLDTLIASIESPQGGAVSVAQPPDVTTYCTLVAVTSAGVESAASLEAEVISGAVPDGGGSGVGYPLYAPEPPLGLTLEDAGRQWYDTDNGNKLHRWDGDTWEPVLIGSGGTADDVLAGKVVPLDTAVALEWGVPNPTAAITGTESWELVTTGWRTYAYFGEADYGGGLVVDGGVYYSLKVTGSTFVNASGVTKAAMTFTLIGSDGAVHDLFTHVNVVYGTFGPQVVDLALVNGEWVVMWTTFVDTNRTKTYVRRFSATTFLQVGSQWTLDEVSRVALGITSGGGSALLLLRYDYGTSQVRIESRSVSTGALVTTTTVAAASLGGVAEGGAFESAWGVLFGSFDFGATRTLINRNGTVYSLITGAVQAGEQFEVTGSFDFAPPTQSLAWDGSRFVAGRAGYTLRQSTANTTTGTLWTSYAHEEAASGLTTAAAPVATAGVTVGRRSGLLLPYTAMPPDVDESPAPDVATIYAWSGATQPALSALREVATITDADYFDRPTAFAATPFAFLSTVPPTLSTFPEGDAGAMASELGGFIVRGDGTGDWPAFRRSIETAHRDLFAPLGHSHENYAPISVLAMIQDLIDRVKKGFVSTGTMVAGTPTNIVVTFAEPYDSGVVPGIQLTIEGGGGNPTNFQAHVNGVATNTGFTIRAVRTSGTAAFDIYWRAEA